MNIVLKPMWAILKAKIEENGGAECIERIDLDLKEFDRLFHEVRTMSDEDCLKSGITKMNTTHGGHCIGDYVIMKGVCVQCCYEK